MKLSVDTGIGGNFIKSMILVHGEIEAIKMMDRLLRDGAVMTIEDDMLKLILWQVIHSLECLTERTGSEYCNLSEVIAIEDMTDDRDTITNARHLILAIDSLTSHV